MLIKFANFTLDVDVERTRVFYERSDIPTMGQQCDCVNCRNFDEAILKTSDTVLDFLRSLGIDPQKPAETFNVTGVLEDDGSIWYSGWYHICGSIVDTPETVKTTTLPDGGEQIQYCWEHGYTPDSHFPFKVLPISRLDLIHKDFPNPVIQLEIDTHLPYVLPNPFDEQ